MSLTTDPADILLDGATTYEKKNADYGDAWRTVGEILFLLSGGEPITLETPEDFVSIGLFTRRMDKIARAFQGEFVGDRTNFESIIDSHSDEAVYAAMHSVNQIEKNASTESRDADFVSFDEHNESRRDNND